MAPPAQDSSGRDRPKEQLRARYRGAEQRRLEEEKRPPDVGQVRGFKDAGAVRLRKLTSESLWSLAESLHRQRPLFSITGSRHRAPALLPAVPRWWREDKLEGRRGDDAARQWGQREGDKLEALLRIQPRLLRRGRVDRARHYLQAFSLGNRVIRKRGVKSENSSTSAGSGRWAERSLNLKIVNKHLLRTAC